MTRLDILKREYQMACHNLYCYSANFLMTKPRDGMEKEWAEFNEEVEILTVWMKELEGETV